MSSLLRLPAASSDYTVTRAVTVPMRDGVELIADHYAPTSAPRGTLVVRGPYGRGFPYSVAFARVYAARGYHVLLQSCRGTFGSGDTFQPMVREAEDGADTVAWLREEPWFTGSFATIGLSYLGFTQWAMLTDPPDELAAAVVLVGPDDFSRAAYGTGAFSLNDFLGWSDTVAHQEEGGALRGLVRQATATKRLAQTLNGLPLAEVAERALEGRAPWYRGWTEHPDLADPYWAPYQVGGGVDRVQVPVLLIGGWQDLFLEQTLDQYRRLSARGADVALTVGPWTHLETLSKGAGIVTRETLEWLGEHLGRDGSPGRNQPVHIHVTGAGQWRELAHWPPSSTEKVLHLHPGGGLEAQAPPPAAPASTFTYDPAAPTPTMGGRLLSASGGYRDDTILAERSDVLCFTGPALGADIEVVGVPVAELAHSTDNPHADVFVRISEVDAKGRSRNVGEGFVRLPVDRPPAPLWLELDAVAHRFRAGSRIRVLVAGGSHPRFDRNLGTGEPPATGTRLRPSRHTVAHGAGGVSRLLLPVVDGPSSEEPR